MSGNSGSAEAPNKLLSVENVDMESAKQTKLVRFGCFLFGLLAVDLHAKST